MKPAPLILAATLLCNAALIALALLKHPTPAPGAAAPNSEHRTLNSELSPTPTLSQLFASDDTQALIQRLREMNLPPDIIRSIAKARLDKEFAARRAALKYPPRPYWRKNSKLPQPKTDPARRDEKLALETEYQAALKDLTAGLPTTRSVYDRRAFGDLPDDKVTQLKIINKDYDDIRAQLRADMQGVTLPGDQTQLDLLDEEQRADLVKILTPDELLDYDLRSSPLANQVQTQIQYFNATESEYTALYDAQAAINEQTAGANLTPAELKQLREDAAQSILTPERFEEYKIATSPSYPDVFTLVDVLELPQTATAQIITTQNETTAQADQIRNDTTLAPAERDTQLAALVQNARQKLTAILGEEGMNRSVSQLGRPEYSVSAWLRQLTPNATQK